MNIPKPHFLLYSRAERRNEQGEWSFVLQAADGSAVLEAEDSEPQARGERLELLAVVRGLEALDQPSHVTLVTTSRYVSRGISYGLEEWRRNGWTWECFGQMVPVKHRDLWQRLDRALGYHRIEFRGRRFDEPHLAAVTPRIEVTGTSDAAGPAAPPRRNASSWRPALAAWRRGWRDLGELLRQVGSRIRTMGFVRPRIS